MGGARRLHVSQIPASSLANSSVFDFLDRQMRVCPVIGLADAGSK
jgi:hypothetical protein